MHRCSVPYDFPILIFCHIGELRPRQGMVEVVLHLVVLRQAEQVTMLHLHKVINLLSNENLAIDKNFAIDNLAIDKN